MKRLFILSAIASLLVTTLSPSWAATNLNSSKSNVNKDACQGQADGTKVKVKGKNMTCQAGLAVSDPGAPNDKPKKSTK